MNLDYFDIIFETQVHWATILVIGTAVTCLLIWSSSYKAKGTLWRLLTLASILLTIFNPVLISNERQLRKDIVILAVDKTKSQEIDSRKETQKKILLKIRQRLVSKDNLDVKILKINDELNANLKKKINKGSLFFGQLKKT